MFSRRAKWSVAVLLLVTFSFGCDGSRGMRTSTPSDVLGESSGGGEVVRVSSEETLPPLPEVEPSPPISPEERQTPLRQGVPAPYSGVLFSPEAVARIEVEFRVLRQQIVRDLEFQRRELEARRVRDVSVLELRVRTQEQEHRVLIEGRDREISRLQERLEEEVESGNPNTFLMILVGVGSAIVGVLSGWFLGQLSR